MLSPAMRTLCFGAIASRSSGSLAVTLKEVGKAMSDLITIRSAEPGDAVALAELKIEAWRYAYRGIIPGLTLERMIARRGSPWWDSARRTPDGSLLLEFDNHVSGYATFGRSRMRGDRSLGEIYELYVKPECHGAGFGRSLFDEARRRLLARHREQLLVWSLAENELACRFYDALGGVRRFRTSERFGGVPLELIGFHWR